MTSRRKESEATDSHIASAAYQTVETFAGIVKKPLFLKNGKQAKSNGTDITAPFDDPDFYLLVERQLAHVLFRSDAKARARFVKDFIESIGKYSDRYGLKQEDRDSVQEVVERVIDILESRRVESLWAMLYPGSYARSKERLQTDAARLLPRANDWFFDLLVCLDAGLEVPAGPMDRFRGLFETSLKRVERRGFTATLALTRWLVSKLVDEILKEDRSGYHTAPGDSNGTPTPGTNGETPDKPEVTAKQRILGLHAMAHQFGQLEQKLANRYNDYDAGRESADFYAQSRAAAATALFLDLRDEVRMEAVLKESEADMQSFLDNIQKQLSATLTHDEWLKQDTRCDLVFVDVRPDDFDAKPLSVPQLSAADQGAVERMRAKFFRVIGRRATTLEEVGSELDLQAYIESRTTGQNIPFFRQETRGRGFRITLLIDRSHSMIGSRIAQAERATRMLVDALDFPFVEVAIWGFQSLEDGQVTITRFSPLLETFHTTKSPVDGATPLHIALKVSVRDLLEGSDAKQLVILTDGAPMYAGANHKLVAEKQLRTFVRDQIQSARRRGINVTTLLVGDRGEDGNIQFDVSKKNTQFMFGSERSWKYVDENRLGEDLVHAVSASFLAYLTH